jgi:CheY-like chemotaxis protein
LEYRTLAGLTPPLEAPQVVTAPAHSYDGARVLIVDHDECSCDALQLLLLDLGYRSTCTAHSATHALSMVGGFLPGIALLELDLPDMSVYRLAQMMRLHAHARSYPLRLIAVATRETHASGDLARAAGFDAYLAKPIQAPVLDELLQSLGR